MKKLAIPKSIYAGLALFLIIRLVIILAFGDTNPPVTTDHEVYHSEAILLTADSRNWVKPGSEFGFRAPGNFAYIATAMLITDSHSYRVSQIACMLLGVLATFLLYILTRTVGGETAGQIAFWLRGLLPNYVLADTYAMSEQLFAVFFLGVLITIASGLRKPGIKHAVMLGVMTAACLLSREAGIIYIIFFVGYLLVSDHLPKQRLVNVAVFLVALTVVLTPWMIRNNAVWGEPLPISYEASMGLLQGNNPGFIGEWTPLDWPEEYAFGTPELSDYMWRISMDYILDDPAAFVGRGFVKLAWWLWPRFQRHDLAVVYPTFGEAMTPVAALSGLASGAILLFGTLAFFSMRPNIFWTLCLAIVLVAVAASMATGGDPRFRDPIEYILLMSAGVLLSRTKIREIPAYVRANMNQLQISVVAFFWFCTIASWLWVISYKFGG